MPELANNGYEGVLSFGGPHSNHAHALAWMCWCYGVPLTLMIRSSVSHPQSATLEDVRTWGAEVQTIPPKQYREKDTIPMMRAWRARYPGYLIIPEGGSHPKSLLGFKSIMEEVREVLPKPDLFICPVGTGATMAGMIEYKRDREQVLGVSALKSSTLFKDLNARWKLDRFQGWTLAEQWHFGGYGKTPSSLLKFVKWFEEVYSIRLDPIYSGKAMFAFFEYVKYQLIPPGSQVVFLHTGGLQGWRGIAGQ